MIRAANALTGRVNRMRRVRSRGAPGAVRIRLGVRVPRTTCATTLRLFAEALDDLGVDREAILRGSGIDPACLRDPDARIPPDQFERVWRMASEASGDPCIGLHAGERVRPRAVNLFGYLMLSSVTLREGLERVARFQRVLTGFPWLRLDDAGDPLRMRVGMENRDPEVRAIHAEYVAPLTLQMMSWVSESDVVPIEAHFAHAARADPSEYERVLRCPVKFQAPASELMLSADVLARESRHGNPRIAEAHEQLGAQLLALRQDPSSAGRVRRLLAEHLEGRPPGLAEVGRQLGMSARSLQRRLAEEGTSFRQVLDALRREIAREHLDARDTTIAEIAYLAGFSEVSAFTRAARRWFGATPAQLRRAEPTGGVR